MLADRLRRFAWLVPLLWIALVEVWFQGPLARTHVPLGLAAPLALAVTVLGVAALRPLWNSDGAVACGREIGLVMVVATLVRLPALAEPGGLISSDSAVAGIIAQDLRTGRLPAPLYAPGFPYEGTLKPHLTAGLGLLLPFASTPLLYAVASHLFFLLWILAAMLLAARAGGRVAALGAGLLLAIPPRFLAAFSLNNVGQYPEVNALGALTLVLLAADAPVVAAFVLGLALWQQLVGLYFAIVMALVVLITPGWRSPKRIAAMAGALLAAVWPIVAWNILNGGATLGFAQRGGKHPLDRITGFPAQAWKTVTVSLPKLFGMTDAGIGLPVGAALAVLPVLLVLVLAWRRRAEMRAQRGRSPVLLGFLLLTVVPAVFALSKFSHRGASRPRYLLPLYTPVALAAGCGLAALARRKRAAAFAAAGTVLAFDLVGLVPWLRGRAGAGAGDRVVLQSLEQQGIRTGYSGFWTAPRFTFLSEERVILSGELGPDVSWVHPRHAAIVREKGPDALIVPDRLGDALAGRLRATGRTFRRTRVLDLALFDTIVPRATLEDVSGYDEGPIPPPEVDDEADEMRPPE